VTVSLLGPRRVKTLLAFLEIYDQHGEDIVDLARQFEQVKDDHPRYNGCFQTFTADLLVVMKNAQDEDDDVYGAIETWIELCQEEIERASAH